MKLWKRAAGALKDRNSIWLASLSAASLGIVKSANNRNPALEAAIIKATSHDEDIIDYKNAQHVFAWIRTSPTSIKPLQLALASRMDKTRSWVVALKGLILMHGVFCCKIPAVNRIGRLPFDLSNFNHRSSSSPRYWAYDAFVRSYFAFLDQRSSLVCLNYSRGACAKQHEDEPLAEELHKLLRLQDLLDSLLQVKPLEEGMRIRLILEAMDCVMIEIFEIYSRICNGVANILLRIYTAGKDEAALALKVVRKATDQGDDLADYFDYCRHIGVSNALEFPQIEKIPEEDIERILDGAASRKPAVAEEENDDEKAIVVKEVIASTAIVNYESEDEKAMKTVIMDKWEVFEEENMKGAMVPYEGEKKTKKEEEERDPFADFLDLVPRYPDYKVPDLITF